MNIKNIIFTLAILFNFSTSLFSAIIYSANSSNWNTGSTWVGGVIPNNSDTVIIDGHNIYIQNIDSITVMEIEINNLQNIGHSKLTVKGNAALRILGNLYMSADNYDYDVMFIGDEFSRIYVDGNTLINRLSTNNKGERLRLNLKNSSQFINTGSFIFNYDGSSLLEINKEIVVENLSKLEINGPTTFNITSGVSLHAYVTNSAQFILNGGLTVNMTGGLATFIESDETSLLKIVGNVDLINTNPINTIYDLVLSTGIGGGNILIEGDLKLLSTIDRADVQLSSEYGSPTITITGDIILDADHEETVSALLGGNSTFMLGGDIIRPKDFGEIKMVDFSMIELNGTTQQTLPASKLPGSGTDSLFLKDIVFNNPSGFILDGNMVVNDSLDLKSGIFTTTDDDLLIIADGAIISGGNDSTYIDGPMRKIGGVQDEPFIFPLGDNGKFAPIEIIPLASSITSVYTAEFDKCPPPWGSFTTTPLEQISQTQFWTITRETGSEDFDVVLHWQDAAEEGINDLDSLVVAGLNTTTNSWETMGNGGTTGSAGVDVPGSVRNDEKCPPPFERTMFTIGSHVSSNALPSEIVSFDGKKIADKIRLDWVTASEISSDIFIVERSIDGVIFNEIDRIDAQGNSNTLQHYTAEDNSPFEGLNYYRLQRVDLDGSTQPTEIIAVNFSIEKKTVRIYPNPVRDYVSIVLENETSKDVLIGVFNQNGQQIFEGKFNVNGSELNLPTQQLNIKNRGIYTILYHGLNRTETLKFIKVE